jgi:hypothetical protein
MDGVISRAMSEATSGGIELPGYKMAMSEGGSAWYSAGAGASH